MEMEFFNLEEPLNGERNISFTASLQHLSSSKIASTFFNKLLPIVDVSSFCDTPFLTGKQPRLRKTRHMKYREIKKKIKKDIRKLTTNIVLQKNITNFISPLYSEIKAWLKTCQNLSLIKYDTLRIIKDNIPQCWLGDGTLDLEKSAKSVVQNSNVLTNRFIFACNYCLYEDVMSLWELLSDREKDELRSNSDYVVKQWITWLESRFNKDWQFCVAWILGTSLWKKNKCVLKRVLEALTPAERNHYLWRALNGLEISCDVMRYVLSLMTKAEKEDIFRELPFDVFRCIASWPVRSSFTDIVENFWPEINIVTFSNILNILLFQLLYQKRDYDELLTILKTFWMKSSNEYREMAINDIRISEPLHFVLNHDFEKEFPKHRYLAEFKDELVPRAFLEHRRMIALFPSFM